MRLKITPFVFAAFILLLSACNKENNYSNEVLVLKDIMIPLSSSNVNFSTTGLSNDAVMHIKIFSDSSMTYDAYVQGVSDKLVGARINAGDPISEGALIIDLQPRVSGGYVSGGVTGMSAGLFDTLLNDNIQKYITVTSSRLQNGLLRGQMTGSISYSKNVPLTGQSVVGGVTTTTTGTAYIRVAADRKLYSKVVIENDDPADPVTSATINTGAAGLNGPVVFTIASSSADFNVGKTFNLTEAQFTEFTGKTSAYYVSVSSAAYPNGKLRGQLK